MGCARGCASRARGRRLQASRCARWLEGGTGRARPCHDCGPQGPPWRTGGANKEHFPMATLTLYHAVPSRSMVARWMLEEVGEPYDIHFLSLAQGENRAADYLAVNPMGKVPALSHGDVVITENAAICTYLADAFPKAGLSVPIGNPRRGIYLKWLFFGPSCIEPAITDRAYPRKEEPRRGALGYGDFETTMNE